MSQRPPTVTIGLPVYNGIPHLEDCLRALLAQDYSHIELLISDNASTDDTAELCHSMTAGRSGVRYVRQPTNIGALANFLVVLEMAEGDYFMWAAHDDTWNKEFVSSLVAKLQENPEAILATPAALLLNEDGTLANCSPDRPAPGTSGMDNLRVLLADHAMSWFYGLYRLSWLKAHHQEMSRYPGWGGDGIWLAELCLNQYVVGSQDAWMFKRLRRSGMAPRGSRAVLNFWMYMFRHFFNVSWRRPVSRANKLEALSITWRYVYRIGMRRSNPISTVWRIVRIVSLAAITSAGVKLLNLVRRKADRPAIAGSLAAPAKKQSDRKAA